MAFLKVENVIISGVSTCVPANIEINEKLPFYKSVEEARQVVEAIGIEHRHISPKHIAVSDLLIGAANSLLDSLGWEKDSLDLLAVVTQTPDYVNHPTSFVVHQSLGLDENTMCLDMYHGCPGWVVGLSSVTTMMTTGCIKRALLLDGDVISKDQDASNREERPLFGDAGTATALEYLEGVAPIYFNIGSKSEDGMALARTQGGYRSPFTMETLKIELDRKAGLLTGSDSIDSMDSMDVFSFAITKAPKAMKRLCANFDLPLADIDKLVLHQANKMIVDAIAKRMKVTEEKVPLSLRHYGNTTSASIPVTLSTGQTAVDYRASHLKTLACGFGTGLSWGAVYFETSNLVIPEVVTIK